MIDLNLTIILTTAVVFLLLLVILNQLLYKPLLGFIDNRNKNIENDLENAEKNSSDVVAYYDEVNKILLDAKNKALQKKITAITEAKSISEKKLTEKRSELEADYNSFLKNLALNKKELQNTLMADMLSYQKSIKNKFDQI